MADKVELKADPVVPPATKGPEAVVQPIRGGTETVTVDTTAPGAPEAPKPTDRPAWLPEEFKTPEEFAEAWKAKSTPPKPAEPTTTEAATTAVEKAGLDMESLQAEYSKEGKLSDESVAKLEKAGITKAQLDQYIEGQKAQATLYTQSLAEAVGGTDALNETLKWAADALTESEITAANAALTSGNAEQAKLVLAGLNSRRLQATGEEPTLVGGRSSPGGSGVHGYESSHQMITDMNSAQYKADPAFRAQVAKRVAQSKF